MVKAYLQPTTTLCFGNPLSFQVPRDRIADNFSSIEGVPRWVSASSCDLRTNMTDIEREISINKRRGVK